MAAAAAKFLQLSYPTVGKIPFKHCYP